MQAFAGDICLLNLNKESKVIIEIQSKKTVEARYDIQYFARDVRGEKLGEQAGGRRACVGKGLCSIHTYKAGIGSIVKVVRTVVHFL